MDANCTRERSRWETLPRWLCSRAMTIFPVAVALVMGFSPAGCRPDSRMDGPAESVTEPLFAPETAAPTGGLVFEPGRPVSLFDGKELGFWKMTEFSGQGTVSVKDGVIYLGMGNYATGITWTGPVVRLNYEISLEAMRAEGSDFFCGLTFPVGESPCTLILGGWGGTLCGLSSLDYRDASENETTTFVDFEKGTWYPVRLRVRPNRIQAWLDDESLVDVDATGRQIDIRMEMDPCVPLGIATWVTTGAVRNITLTKLADTAEQ